MDMSMDFEWFKEFVKANLVYFLGLFVVIVICLFSGLNKELNILLNELIPLTNSLFGDLLFVIFLFILIVVLKLSKQ
jgi:hypothetical protein